MYLSFASVEQVVEALQSASSHSQQLLWLLSICDGHADDIPALLERCRDQGLEVCGGIFPGIIHGDRVEKTGLLATPMPAGSRAFLARMINERASWSEPVEPLVENGMRSSVLYVDCLAPGISNMMEELYNLFGNRLNHFGAGTGFHDLRAEASIFTLADGLVAHAALMVASPRATTVRVRHGWSRVAGPFVASRTDGNLIQELNWEPAGAFYRQRVTEENPDLAGRPVFPDMNAFYPLCIPKEGGEDVMRDPIMVTENDALKVLSDVGENSAIYLAHGDQDTLIEAAREAVRDCGKPDDVELCLVSDCFSRNLMLGDDFPRELAAVNDELRAFTDIQPEGVLALGEIANNHGQFLELFNKTFVIALLHRQ